jgi:hypothetical protein
VRAKPQGAPVPTFPQARLVAVLKFDESPPSDPYTEFAAHRFESSRPHSLGDLGGLKPVPWEMKSPKARQDETRRLIGQHVSSLVEMSGLQPRLVTDSKSPAGFDVLFVGSTAKGHSLLAVLTAQVLVATVGGGFALCTGCGRVFVLRQRQPSHGRGRYCADCRSRGGPQQRAKAKYDDIERRRKAGEVLPPRRQYLRKEGRPKAAVGTARGQRRS